MDQKQTFRLVVQTLNELGAEYMITGGFAVSFWGKPRSTHDLDVLIKIQIQTQKANLIGTFRDLGFYVSEEAVEDAIARKFQFNIIHPESDLKVDFWVVGDDERHNTEFQRKHKEKVLDNEEVYMISPEDLILIKLEWYKDSNSSRHLEDAQGIYEIQKDNLDIDYLKTRAVKFGLADTLSDLIKTK